MTNSNQKLLSVPEATAELQRLAFSRQHISLSALRFSAEYSAERDGLALRIETPEGASLDVDEVPEKTILRTVGLSRKFLESCRDNVDLARSALDQGRRAEDCRVLMIRQGTRLVGMTRAQKDDLTLSPMDVWDAIRDQEGIMAAAGITPMRNGELDIRLVVQENRQPVRRPGDVTQLGVRINIGSKVSLNPYLFRLVCSNGMQAQENGDIQVVSLADPLESLRSLFGETLIRARAFGDRFIQADDVTVPNPHEYVMRSLRIAGANDSLRSRVADGLSEHAPNGTLYEILNIMTAIARESADRPKTRNRIESIAGRVVEMQAGAARCRTCNSSV